MSDRDDATDETLVVGVESTASPQGRAPGSEPASPPEGATVGRYTILSRLGAGGMGVVYAAYDPQLDRKVALKLVLPEPGGGRNSVQAHERLMREARALAKLSHPNVVSVHDVGMWRQQVWIAMEFVQGQTLGHWAAAQPRRWREVVEVMLEAGRGLAAAHAASLLHRDFKPDNVMLDEDGRVRVMDFGVARSREDDEPGLDTGESLGSSSGSVSLTRTGMLVGTPAYMAPEQLSEAEVTPAADQFAFCVTLWELLYGDRPFSGDNVAELATSVIEGTIRTTASDTEVPVWLRRICVRGLEVDPRDRFVSMDELLRRIESERRRISRRRRLLGLGVVAAALAAVPVAQGVQRTRAEAACAEEARAIEEVWNDDARSAVQESIGEIAVPHVEMTRSRVFASLDEYAQQWAAARESNCRQVKVEEVWEPVLLEQTRWCLDERLMELEAFVQTLYSADEELVERAIGAAARLSRIEPCRERDELSRRGLPASDIREEARRIRSQLVVARVLRQTHRIESAAMRAQQALADAVALEWIPLVAAARVEVGIMSMETGDLEGSRETLMTAYFEAARAGAQEPAVEAATRLVDVERRQSRHERALLWAKLADVQLAQLGRGDDLRRVALDDLMAGVYESQARFDEALQWQRKALEAQTALLGEDHLELTGTLERLASIHRARGELSEALALSTRIVEIREQRLGTEHPRVARALLGLANVHFSRGEYAPMQRLIERALQILEASLPLDHPSVLKTLNNLAEAHRMQGHREQAREIHEYVLALLFDLGEQDPIQVAQTLNNLALIHFIEEDYEDALVLYRRSLEIRIRWLGPDHPNVAWSLGGIGAALMELGHLEGLVEARQALERSVEIHERAVGPDHPDVTHALVSMAQQSLRDEQFDDAVAYTERIYAIRETNTVSPFLHAQSCYLLSQALWGAGRDRERARQLARHAAETYRSAERVEQRLEAERWLQQIEAGARDGSGSEEP